MNKKENHFKKEINEKKDLIIYEYKGRYINIETLEQAIKYYKIDLKKYKVDRFIQNKWDSIIKNKEGHSEQVTNQQIKIFISPNTEDKSKILKELKQELLEKIQHLSKYHKVKKPKDAEENILQVNIFDAHIDRLGWYQEMYHDHKEIKEVVEDHIFTALNNVLEKAKFCKPEKILLPIGNDWFNDNGSCHTTKRGTPQNSLSNWKDSFIWGCRLIIEIINRLEIIAPVDILVIPSNHDEDKIFYLGEVIKNYYFRNDNIIIDNNIENRVYYNYGKNLIGFTHGDKNSEVDNLPYLMAHEQRNLWSNTTHREWYIGHIHHKQDIKYKNTQDSRGVTIRYMRNSNPITDKWSSDMGYVMSHSSIEAFVWDKEGGISATFIEYMG